MKRPHIWQVHFGLSGSLYFVTTRNKSLSEAAQRSTFLGNLQVNRNRPFCANYIGKIDTRKPKRGHEPKLSDYVLSVLTEEDYASQPN